jgi:hypothetical protein
MARGALFYGKLSTARFAKKREQRYNGGIMRKFIKNSLFILAAVLVIVGIIYVAIQYTSISPLDPAPDTRAAADNTADKDRPTATAGMPQLPEGAIVPPAEWSPAYSGSLCWDSNSGCTVGRKEFEVPPLCYDWEPNQGCSTSGGSSVISGLFIDNGLTKDGYGAVEYCQHLEADGITLNGTAQNLWRLPTIQEFVAITDYTKGGPATKVSGFSSSFDGYYWSSTEFDASGAWLWSSLEGATNINGRHHGISVRCVR